MLYTNDGAPFKDFKKYIPDNVKFPLEIKLLNPRQETLDYKGYQVQRTVYSAFSSQYIAKVVIDGSQIFVHKGDKVNKPNGEFEIKNNAFHIGTDGFLKVNNEEELFCLMHHPMCLTDNFTKPFRSATSAETGHPTFEFFDSKVKEKTEFAALQREANFKSMLVNMTEDKLKVAYINAGNGADEDADRAKIVLFFSNLATTNMAEAERLIMTSNLGEVAIIKEAIEKKKLLYVPKHGTFTVAGAKSPYFTVSEGLRDKQDALNSLIQYIEKGDSDKSILVTLKEMLG